MPEPIRADDARPSIVNTQLKTIEALIKTERNRLFILTLSLVLVVFLALAFCWHAYNTSTHNKELMYIKLYPNGSWENVTYHAQDTQLYFKTTVDSLLATYVTERYQIDPVTIGQNYGEALLFMSPALAQTFISPQGFNASQKAANTETIPNKTTTVTWQWNDHYDGYNGQLNGQTVQVERTNIYFTKQMTQAGVVSLPQPMMLTVSWTLLPKTTLAKKSSTFLKVNPIGLQILSQKLVHQPNLEHAHS